VLDFNAAMEQQTQEDLILRVKGPKVKDVANVNTKQKDVVVICWVVNIVLVVLCCC
jgi:hypothetical protein